MSKIELQRIHVGTINIPDGRVDVTDPCYDEDVWCRITRDVKPGEYDCYAYTGVDKDWGNRVWIAQIVTCEDDDVDYAEDAIYSGRSWRTVGNIGVDAGLAGFFSHKPDFNDDEWSELCSEMKGSRAFVKTFSSGDGFWTESGCGDGVYPVYAIRNKGKIVALEIRF